MPLTDHCCETHTHAQFQEKVENREGSQGEDVKVAMEDSFTKGWLGRDEDTKAAGSKNEKVWHFQWEDIF